MCQGCPEFNYTDSEDSAEQSLRQLISERVGRGVEFLNEELGEAWAYDVNTTRLDLSDTQHCVIGQLYASRPEGFDGWFLFHQKHVPSGSWMTDRGFDDMERENYEYLTHAWTIRIAELIKP